VRRPSTRATATDACDPCRVGRDGRRGSVVAGSPNGARTAWAALITWMLDTTPGLNRLGRQLGLRGPATRPRRPSLARQRLPRLCDHPTEGRDPARRSRRLDLARDLTAGAGPLYALSVSPDLDDARSWEGRAGLPRGQVRGVRHPPGPPPLARLRLRRDGLRLLACPRLLGARAALGAPRVPFQGRRDRQESWIEELRQHPEGRPPPLPSCAPCPDELWVVLAAIALPASGSGASCTARQRCTC
jgi:hypothetical protein